MAEKRGYEPTPAEREAVRFRPEHLIISGDAVFATKQGEGVTAGEPSVFLRLHRCNLACGKNGGWNCDTGYTWDKDRKEFWQEPAQWTYDDAAANIRAAWQEKFGNKKPARLVITGGEPLLQQRKLVELIKKLPGWIVEIETNGSIKPIDELRTCQFNCSPKLENSGNPKNRRYNPDALRKINAMRRSQFKFVVVQPSDLDEVAEIVAECRLDTRKVFIMPEGQTAEAVAQHEKDIEAAVKARGWKIIKRHHLDWYGAQRRT